MKMLRASPANLAGLQKLKLIRPVGRPVGLFDIRASFYSGGSVFIIEVKEHVLRRGCFSFKII